MSKHLYSVPYRREGELVLNRVHRVTVVASSAEEARAFARLRDPRYAVTAPPGPRRGREVVAEQADGLTAAKAREFVEWRGASVEVVD